MAGRSRSKGKPKPKPDTAVPAAGVPTARALPAQRSIHPDLVTRGRVEVGAGVVLIIVAIGLTMSTPDTSTTSGLLFMVIHVLGLLGAFAIAAGATHLDRRADVAVRDDKRRWIYGALSLVFFVVYALCIWKVIPNRLPSAMVHLTTVPSFTLMMAIGVLVGRRFGWWVAVTGGSLVLLSTIVMIARILISAAFLAGVYGAFGKAAATFALVSVALIIEVVALLPICLVKFLMSRPGRRTYGV